MPALVLPEIACVEKPMKKSGSIVSNSRLFATMCGIAVVALVASTPGVASEYVGRDVTVRYADLDVNSVAGATQLLGRIQGAAERVCAPLDHGNLSSRVRRDACERKLTAEAVGRVNSSALLAVHESAHRAAPRVIALAR